MGGLVRSHAEETALELLEGCAKRGSNWGWMAVAADACDEAGWEEVGVGLRRMARRKKRPAYWDDSDGEPEEYEWFRVGDFFPRDDPGSNLPGKLWNRLPSQHFDHREVCKFPTFEGAVRALGKALLGRR